MTTPMLTLIAIATTPHATTRAAARRGGAPPAIAPAQPKAPSARIVTTTVAGMRSSPDAATAMRGMTAPEMNARADAPAAWSGRARAHVVESDLVPGVRAKRVGLRQGDSHLVGEIGVETPVLVDPGELVKFLVWVCLELAGLEREVGVLRVLLR